LDKENEALSLRSMGQQQSNRIGLVEAREIEKIAVLAKRPLTICVMGRESSGGNDGRCRSQLLNEAPTPERMDTGIKRGQTCGSEC
jgi:hypothetical protein